jgi:hypothetical protein
MQTIPRGVGIHIHVRCVACYWAKRGRTGKRRRRRTFGTLFGPVWTFWNEASCLTGHLVCTCRVKKGKEEKKQRPQRKRREPKRLCERFPFYKKNTLPYQVWGRCNEEETVREKEREKKEKRAKQRRRDKTKKRKEMRVPLAHIFAFAKSDEKFHVLVRVVTYTSRMHLVHCLMIVVLGIGAFASQRLEISYLSEPGLTIHANGTCECTVRSEILCGLRISSKLIFWHFFWIF